MLAEWVSYFYPLYSQLVLHYGAEFGGRTQEMLLAGTETADVYMADLYNSLGNWLWRQRLGIQFPS